jgi:very-short-patch-repair endonuclease
MRKRVSERAREFARGLRTNQTDAEWRLWVCLRAGRLAGLKFKRQTPMDGYIVDFVCLEARLIVEIDGGQHAQSMRDRIRDGHFAAAGFKTLRFWNNEVIEDADVVAHQIQLSAESRVRSQPYTRGARLIASSPSAGEDSGARERQRTSETEERG